MDVTSYLDGKYIGNTMGNTMEKHDPLKKNDLDVAVFLGQKCGTCPQVMCEVLKIPSSKGVDFLQFNRLARHSMAWKISDIYRFFPNFRIYI